jgi:hypothetical protein
MFPMLSQFELTERVGILLLEFCSLRLALFFLLFVLSFCLLPLILLPAKVVRPQFIIALHLDLQICWLHIHRYPINHITEPPSLLSSPLQHANQMITVLKTSTLLFQAATFCYLQATSHCSCPTNSNHDISAEDVSLAILDQCFEHKPCLEPPQVQ